MFLFEHNYWALSGSMQCTLLRIAELAKEIGEGGPGYGNEDRKHSCTVYIDIA